MPSSNRSRTSVNVGPMSDGQDENDAARIFNPIDDSIVPTMGRMLTLEFEPQRSPDPARLVRQRAVDELDR
jgi:hypothetical protein